MLFKNSKVLASVFVAVTLMSSSSVSSFAMIGGGVEKEATSSSEAQKFSLGKRIDCGDHYEFGFDFVVTWPKLKGKSGACEDINKLTEKLIKKLVKNIQKAAGSMVKADESILDGFTISADDFKTHIGIAVSGKVKVPKPNPKVADKLPGIVLSCSAKVV